MSLAKRVGEFCCNPLNRRYRFRPVVHVRTTISLIFALAVIFAIMSSVFDLDADTHFEQCQIEYPSFVMGENNDGAPEDWISWDFPWVTPGETAVCDPVEGCYRDDLVHISSNNCRGLEKKFQDRNTKSKIEGYIKIYYHMTPYYQNHRRYALSRNYAQLIGTMGYDGKGTGVSLTTDPMAICTPLITLNDLQDQFGIFDEDSNPKPGYPPLSEAMKAARGTGWDEIQLYPCGLQAFSVFTDTFTAFEFADASHGVELGDEIPIYSDRNLIITEPDKVFYQNIDGGDDSKFYKWMPKQFEGSESEGSYLENSHWINWMRLSPRDYVFKLYGTFSNSDTEVSTIELPMTIKVRNRYDISNWGGKKYIVIAAQSRLGTIPYANVTVTIVVACLSMFVVIFFSIKHKLQPRMPGDIKYIGTEYQLNL